MQAMQILRTFAQSLYLFSPLLVSVALSAIVHRYDLFRSWRLPIDGGRKLWGKRLFGDSKTWRGVAVAVMGSIATVAIQKHVLATALVSIAVVDYVHINPVIFGAVMGVFAMAGELPNSFVKRQLGISPGGTASRPTLRALFWIWDQIDLLTLVWPALLLWLLPTCSLVVASFLLGLVIHPLVAWLGFAIGARRTAR